MQPCSVANSRCNFPVASFSCRRSRFFRLDPSGCFIILYVGSFLVNFPRRTRSCFTTQPFQLSMQSFPDRVSDLARTVPVGRPVGQDRGRAVCSGEASVRCRVFRARIRSGFRSVFPSRCPGRLSVPHVSGRPFGVHSGVQPLRVRSQFPNGSVPLGCIRPFLAVAARPCRLFGRRPGGFVAPCGSDLRLPDRSVTGSQGCRSAGTNPDAKIAKKFYRASPPEHSRSSIPVRVSLSARSCPVCRRLRSIRLSVRSTLSPLFLSESPAPVSPFALPLSGSSGLPGKDRFAPCGVRFAAAARF